MDLYVAGQFMQVFIVCMLGVPFLFWVINLVDTLDVGRAGNRPGFGAMAAQYFFEAPYHSLVAFPIALLLSSAFTVSNFARRMELVAVKAGGTSFYRFSLPIVICAAGLSVGGIGLAEVAAAGQRKAREVSGEGPSLTGRRSTFVFAGDNETMYKVRSLDANQGRMTEVQIERAPRSAGDPRMNAAAAQAIYQPGLGRWLMEDGWMRLMPAEGRETAFQFAELQMRSFDADPDELLATENDQRQGRIEDKELRYGELEEAIRGIERSGGEPLLLRTLLAQRIAYPFSGLVITLFGISLAHTTRRGGTPTALAVALLTTFLYIILIEIGEAAGGGGLLSPAAAAWIPNMVFLVLGLVMFWRVRT